jgi:hypothetical protein
MKKNLSASLFLKTGFRGQVDLFSAIRAYFQEKAFVSVPESTRAWN